MNNMFFITIVSHISGISFLPTFTFDTPFGFFRTGSTSADRGFPVLEAKRVTACIISYH